MDALTARMYQIKKLGDNQIKILHVFENKTGLHWAPCAIHERFNTVASGDIPTQKQDNVYRTAWGIFLSEQKKYASWCEKEDLEFKELEVLHRTDFKFLAKDIDMSGHEVMQKERGNVKSRYGDF